MRVGTPGFVPDRLKEAREIRGLTAVALAEIVEVSPQSISQYEKGRSSPSRDVLERVARAVNVPTHFFLLPEREDAGGTVFFRSMASTTKSARARAKRRYGWLRDIVTYLSDFVELPAANFPDLRLPADPLMLADDEIEQAAEDLRSYWGLREGPIANMVLLLEAQGAILARDRLGAESLDGLSEFVGRPYIMIGTDKGTAVRWRFDAAHELGHLVLHASVPREQLLRPEIFKRIENQAHRFAAAFLLPLAQFGDDLFGVNLDAFVSMKPKWGVAVSMMIRRAQDAGFVSEETARKLWINHSRRGWKRREPFDDTLPAEEPRLLQRSFELVLERGAQTTEDILTALALPASDVESLAGLSSGFLGGYSPVRLIEPQLSSAPEQWQDAEILELPFGRRR